MTIHIKKYFSFKRIKNLLILDDTHFFREIASYFALDSDKGGPQEHFASQVQHEGGSNRFKNKSSHYSYYLVVWLSQSFLFSCHFLFFLNRWVKMPNKSSMYYLNRKTRKRPNILASKFPQVEYKRKRENVISYVVYRSLHKKYLLKK